MLSLSVFYLILIHIQENDLRFVFGIILWLYVQKLLKVSQIERTINFLIFNFYCPTKKAVKIHENQLKSWTGFVNYIGFSYYRLEKMIYQSNLTSLFVFPLICCRIVNWTSAEFSDGIYRGFFCVPCANFVALSVCVSDCYVSLYLFKLEK